MAAADPSLRLAFVLTHPTTAEKLMRGQLAYLRRQGFEVLVIASPGTQLEEVRTREGVATLAVPIEREIRPLRDLSSLLRLVRALRRWRPDIVNAGTPKAGLLGSLAAWLCRVPCRIYTARGLRLETTRGAKRRLLAVAERLAAACAHRVVCVSPSLRRRIEELGLARPAKLVVLGPGGSNGVDVARFRHLREDRKEIEARRRSLGLGAGTPVVGFVGRWNRDKGLPELLAAFETVLAAMPEARILALGAFETGDPVPEETARRWREHPAILRPGFVADAGPFYPLMTVLAFPSHREGLPNVPLEAAAAGLPVVGFRVTGTVDAVADSRTGTLTPPGEPEALAEALLTYLRDPELARAHGEAGRRRVGEEFARERVWRRWRDLYRELAAPTGCAASR